MVTAVARSREGLTNRLKLEIIGFGVIGLILFVAGMVWLISTGFETKLSAVPVAFGGIGIGFSIFGLVAVSKALKGWEPGQQVARVDNNGLDFAGLGNIPWDNLGFVISVGEHKDELSVGFGVAAAGHGQQAKLHSPIAKMFKQPAKHKIGSTYLVMLVENAPQGFGENFELGTVKPMAGEQNMYQVIISPNVFLDKANYEGLLASIKQNVEARRNVYAHYYNAVAAVLYIAGWAQYRVAGVHARGNTLVPGTVALYDWFNSLSDAQILDTLQRHQAITSQPGFLEAREQAITNITKEIAQRTGRDAYSDKLYSAGWALVELDRLLKQNPKAKLAEYQNASSVIEFAVFPYLAQQYGVNVDTQTQQLLLDPLFQAGFPGVQAQAPQQPSWNSQPVAPQQPQAPQASASPLPSRPPLVMPPRPQMPQRPNFPN